jgi:hypothetical protein
MQLHLLSCLFCGWCMHILHGRLHLSFPLGYVIISSSCYDANIFDKKKTCISRIYFADLCNSTRCFLFPLFFLFLGIDIHSLLHGTTTVVTCGSAVLTTCTIPL